MALFDICKDHATTRDDTILVLIWGHATARDNGTVLVYMLKLWVMALVLYVHEVVLKVRIIVLYCPSYCFAA
jgi:hypothetical protein